MDVKTVEKMLEEISNDVCVPRNVRSLIDRARSDLNQSDNEEAVRINSAVSVLDEVSNDQNIPAYTRTQVWNIVSILEVIVNQLDE